LEEHWNTDVFGKLEQRVEVADDFMVGALLVELFEVTPESLKWFLIGHNIFSI
jgi:hypothetical protein